LRYSRRRFGQNFPALGIGALARLVCPEHVTADKTASNLFSASANALRRAEQHPILGEVLGLQLAARRRRLGTARQRRVTHLLDALRQKSWAIPPFRLGPPAELDAAASHRPRPEQGRRTPVDPDQSGSPPDA